MTVSNRTMMGPALHTAHIPKPQRFLSPEAFSGDGSESATPVPDFHISSESRSQSGSSRASGSSLYESKCRKHRVEDATAEHGMGFLSKTDLRAEVKPEEASVPLETQLNSPQLGILICLSATLGVALAAGLCYLCTQYCYKRTARVLQ